VICRVGKKSKNVNHRSLHITSQILADFQNSFTIIWKYNRPMEICHTTIIKYPTSPQMRRYTNCSYSMPLATVFKVVMGKSIPIDSNRFTLPNRYEKFRFSKTAKTLWLRASLCCKITSWLTFASMSLLASAKAISSSVVMLADQLWLRWAGPGASDQSPEPLVLTVEGVLTEQRIEYNWIESFSFLPNRPSLLHILA